MSPQKHLASALVLGGAIFTCTKDPAAAAAGGIAAVASDTDHVLEYVYDCIKKRRKPSVREFMSGSYFSEKGTIYIVFHGWEYALLLLGAAIFCYIRQCASFPILCSSFFGYVMHLIFDTVVNDCTFRGYWLCYRIKIRFLLDRICSADKRENKQI